MSEIKYIDDGVPMSPDSSHLHLVQVEGDMFKGGFLCMQQRALVKPRVPVLCVLWNRHFLAILTLSDTLAPVQIRET